MRLRRDADEPVSIPLTSLFDIVMLLMVSFIVSFYALGGAGDIAGIKVFVVPKEAGNAKCNLLVQLSSQGIASEVLILSTAPSQVGRLQGLLGNISNRNVSWSELRRACKQYNIPLLPIGNMQNVQAAIDSAVARYISAEIPKVKLDVVVRAESDIPYYQVLEVLDCFDANYVRSRADVNSVLLVGPLFGDKSSPGLLQSVDIVECPPPPTPPCRESAKLFPGRFRMGQ